MHRRDKAREGNQKLGYDGCAHCIRMDIIILNWLRPLWEGA
jgi:hypothetical protein